MDDCIPMFCCKKTGPQQLVNPSCESQRIQSFRAFSSILYPYFHWLSHMLCRWNAILWINHDQSWSIMINQIHYPPFLWILHSWTSNDKWKNVKLMGINQYFRKIILGKLSYFTNLNCSAMNGDDFPIHSPWFQASGEQWGRDEIYPDHYPLVN